MEIVRRKALLIKSINKPLDKFWMLAYTNHEVEMKMIINTDWRWNCPSFPVHINERCGE